MLGYVELKCMKGYSNVCSGGVEGERERGRMTKDREEGCVRIRGIEVNERIW